MIGGSVSLGWIFGVPALKSVLPGLTTMKFNTAVALMLASGGLLMIPRRNLPSPLWRYWAAVTMGSAAALLGALSLGEYFGMPLGIDELFISDPHTTSPPYPGRMSPATAAGLASAGAAVVLLASAMRTPRSARPAFGFALAHLLAAVPAAIGYLSLAGYAYHVDGLYKFGPYVSVAMLTAVALVLLAVAILFTLPDLGWRCAFADRPIALHLLTRLLPLAVAAPFIAGLWVVEGVRHDIYDALYGPAILALAAAATSFALAWVATLEVRKAEGHLRMSEARLRLLQQVGGIAYSDRLLTQSSLLISREFARIHGLPLDQTRITLQEWAELLHPEDRERYFAERQSALDNGGTINIEFRIQRPDGVVRWITSRGEVFLGPDGKPFRVINAWQDTTDIVAAREALASRQQELERSVMERTVALAEAEARFRGIFDSQLQFISLLAPDGTVLEMNRTALEAAALSRTDVIGRPFWETYWWPLEERDRLRQEIAGAASGALIYREVEVRGARNRHIWIDFSLKPVRDLTTGTVISIIAESRDQTEKRNLASQLAQAQKVQALGQLAGGIAHDFNNILQAVSGAAMLIEQKPGDLDRTRRLAGTMIAAANRGTSITQRLLSFARRGELRSVSIPTADLLNGVCEVLSHTLGTTITVAVDVAPDVPPLVADQAQLETALINLGTNARDAMPNGGTLTLSAEVEHVGAFGHHPAGLLPGDYVRLSVVDNGAGMDAATLARVSEPFFTTKPSGQGTGLGVAMVKGFAEQSGGGLSISSVLHQGTTVVMWLRQASTDCAQGHDEEAADPTGVDMAARILIVDDDDLVRETVAAQLEAEGFTTLVAASGLEAVAMIEAGEIVDAMVSDLSMPGINGVTTIQKVRARRPRLPCFLLTGYVGERAALSSEDAFTLVRKPVVGRALAAQIEASLAGVRRSSMILSN